MSDEHSPAKLWAGRFTEPTDALVERFTESVSFDRRLAKHDIRGSIAHATMLAEVGVLSGEDRDAIVAGLESILADIEAGAFEWRTSLEDVHMNVESVLTERIGDAGKRLHTGRRATTRSPPTCGCSCATRSTTSPARFARCRR